MFLTRMFLNARSRAVRQDVADPGQMHRTVMAAFPDGAGVTPRKAHGVLYRLEEERDSGRLSLFVQSSTVPNWACLPDGYLLDLGDAFSEPVANPAVRDVAGEREGLVDGDRLVFRLRANATRKIDTKTRSDGAKSNGRRVPVRGDDARLAWLARHGEAAGFAIESARVSELPTGRSRLRGLSVGAAQFDGILVVKDVSRFRLALAEGIGPGKAFGLGLLSILRARAA